MERFEMNDMERSKKEGNLLKDAFVRWIGLFLVLVAALLVALVVTNIHDIVHTIGKYVGLIKPVVYGCVIAYILNPLMKQISRTLIYIVEKTGRKVSGRQENVIKGFSIFLSMIAMFLVIIILCWMIIPQLITTVSVLIETLPTTANKYYQQIESSIRNNQFIMEQFQEYALSLTDNLENVLNQKILPWLQSDLLPNVNLVAAGFASGVMSFFSVIYNLFIGMIVAIYILGSKNTFSAQAKKILYGLLKKEYADVVLHYVKVTDKMFSGFIIGKIVDSTIVGIICYVTMLILHLPYPLLISVIVGVTNIIPVFGPYIGLVPSVFLILLVNPIQALYFIILIAILQQVDGNLIGPAILGESTGLTGFWVLFSILLFGGMWGILGMIVGVPLFAVIYRIIADYINWRLERKALSTVTDDYKNLNYIDVAEKRKITYIKYTEADLNKQKKKADQTFLDKIKCLRKKKNNVDSEANKGDGENQEKDS